MPAGFNEGVSGVCHRYLLFINDTSPKASRKEDAAQKTTHPSLSFIRTITVGSGISPDLLTPNACSSTYPKTATHFSG